MGKTGPEDMNITGVGGVNTVRHTGQDRTGGRGGNGRTKGKKGALKMHTHSNKTYHSDEP